MIEIVLNSIPPSKKNSKQIFKNKKTGKPFIASSENFKQWHQTSLANLIPTKLKVKKIIEKCRISIYFFYPDKRRRDLTNQAESVMDLLVDSKIIKDDSWLVVNNIDIRGFYSKNKPQTIVCVYPDELE